jgi:hypothetical protein
MPIMLKYTRNAARNWEFRQMSAFIQGWRVSKVLGKLFNCCARLSDILLKILYCSGLKQSTLDGVIARQPKPPVFTTDALLDYIVKVVVSEDEVSPHGRVWILSLAYLEHPQAFQLINKRPFRQLLMYLRPALGEKDIPHHTKFQAETLSRAKAVENMISEIFKACHFYRLCYGDLGMNNYTIFRLFWARFHLPSTPGLPRLVTHTFH